MLTDVVNSYENLQTNDQVVQLYESGYLKEAEDSRDISQYAYERGGASLLDFLDAERSYRATELAYRQALAIVHDSRSSNFAKPSAPGACHENTQESLRIQRRVAAGNVWPRFAPL